MTPNITQGWIPCSRRLSGECGSPRPSGTVSAARTPAIVAWIPLASIAVPEKGEAKQVRPQAANAEQVQRSHEPQQESGEADRHRIEVRGVDQGDDQDRSDIIDDGDGDEQQLDGRVGARPEQGEHPNRKGNVGRRWDRPAANQRRVEPGHRQIDDGRDDHPGGGGDDGQSPLGRGRQPSVVPLALHLQPDEQEEDGHQSVRDPLVDRHDAEARHRRTDFGFENVVEGVRQAAVGEDQSDGCGGDQEKPGALLLRLQFARVSGHGTCLARRSHKKRPAALGERRAGGTPAGGVRGG